MRPRKIILYCDYRPAVLSECKFMLTLKGYRVVTAHSSEEALDILRHAAPYSIDILISELTMPGMEANELARLSKAYHPSMPVMIVSDKVASFGDADNADAFLPRGFCSAAEIVARVKILIQRKRGPRKAETTTEQAAVA